MKKLVSFFKKDFVKNVLTLITGSGISQVIIYGSTLILTRLFSEEAFGVLMLFSSSLILLKPIASLQYELAILLPKRNKDAINLFAFSILLSFLICTAIFLVLFFFKNNISTFFGLEQLSFYIYFLPIAVFLFSSISIIEYWHNRSNLFKNISKGVIAKSISMSTIQITTGFSNLHAIGLIPGVIVGLVFQLLFLIKKSVIPIKETVKHISFRRMFFLAKKYKDIPIFSTVISFTNQLSNELPVYLISNYFGLGNAGIYGLAVKISKAPIGIIQNSISQVFFNKASKQYNNNQDLNLTVKKTYKNLLLIGAFLFTSLFILSFFFDFILGENWTKAGTYVRILIPWLFIAFLNAPLSSLILILNKQKTILVYDILLLTSRFLAFYIGYTQYKSIIISLALYSSVGILFNLFILFYFLKISTLKKDTYS
ncbi:O-antigen translocase [Tenacibaculum sp. 190524A02b]|uniref:lipopolysaccharide biosynthesis protein n=1 Tax=Tenacibaculum vairaonense TaxID=3137860 RepID=UPI0032B12D63